MNYLLIILIGAGAAFVQRVSGFGLGIFAMMFFPYIFPAHTAAATVSSLFSCYTTTFNSIKYRKDISLKTALPMMLAALVTIPVAVRFAEAVPGDVFKKLLGAVLIVLCVYFLFLGKRIKIKPTAVNGVIAGSLGGILGGLFSTGGPPAVLYLTAAAPDKNVYFATIQFYFCFTNLYATAMRALNGVLTLDILISAAVGIIGCIVGDLLGGLVFDKLDGQKVKTVIYIGMVISGILMII